MVLAVLVGLALGLLGGGGSILVVPIFSYALGYGAKQAIVMSLVVVGCTSLLGAMSRWRLGHVKLRIALPFGAGTMVAAYIGARLAAFVSEPVQLILFAFVVLLAAVAMFRFRPAAAQPSLAGGYEASRTLPPLGRLVLEGSGVGILTGLVGVGGGFLIVPVLTLLAKLPMEQAVGTSLLVIAMNALAGFAGYVGQVEIDWETLALFTAITTGGIFAGTFLGRYVPQGNLRRGFAVFLVGIGTFVLYQNRGVFVSMA